ncbi:amidase family protein [Myceligenerans pegani]|uniref:Glutamyl-tRNA amidotransferase n=1 Tax=Myceligenerans pegani TaxID=2776917 RepID=A0ABR9N3G2_9MICO|nr:amidase family protein [Myceligenerans sp. TRM 65318]MBE1877796.1 glutamyl-tRNA amidotransferase [Myceligenerans sp. TRM 65318]MBE3020067.1 glutamyl-tRNA amidotransferase [Myceligenerans sp. TRM 65318]
MDSSVWRVLGGDGGALVAPTGSGVLDGETVAVKDLFAVAGQRVGAGNPAWLERADVEPAHAPAVARLLAAGAAVTGIARTEEFAWSLTGANAHYGTPPNPAAPGRISGGSTSGPATAVAGGEVSIGLGTDTSGSIRVPAAYQRLWGFRPTHGVISGDGVLPLAPSFDTVGWLTRDPDLLARVGDVLLPPDTAGPADRAGTPITGAAPFQGRLVPAGGLLELAEPGVRSAVEAWLGGQVASDGASHRAGLDAPPFTGLPDEWVQAVRVVQAAEAWEAHGEWIADHLDELGPAVRGRFQFARSVTPGEAAAARKTAAEARSAIRDRLGDDVLVLPAASSVAPPAGDPDAAEAVRAATVTLCATVVLGGLPALAVPLRTADDLPTAACLVGPAGSDRTLLAMASQLTA